MKKETGGVEDSARARKVKRVQTEKIESYSERYREKGREGRWVVW